MEYVTPKRLIAIVVIIIGLILTTQGYELKSEYQDTMSYIMKPLDKISGLLENPDTNFTFDADEYLTVGTSKIVNTTKDAVEYRIKLTEGLAAIILGIGLLMVRIGDEEDFWNATFKFFKPS